MHTHYAVIVCSGRLVPVIRRGRLLIVLHSRSSVSTCTYDGRFHLMPKGWRP